MTLKDSILQAARADAIPAGSSGLWWVQKQTYTKPMVGKRDGKFVTVPPGSYTYLMRGTAATMHHTVPGETVMHDTPDELQTHLDFMLRARGQVLITGLGLGCVARGVLANPQVTQVTLIDNSPDVLHLVLPYMPVDNRLCIIEAEAEAWCKQTDRRFDCAWHDLWTDVANGEPHLAVKHSGLLVAMASRVDFQGAWAFPREHRRLWKKEINLL